LLGFIESLPTRSSAFARSRLGEDVASWSSGVEMQAATVDLLHVILRTLQQAHFENVPTGEIPRIPRPLMTGAAAVAPASTAVSLSDFASLIRED
jgi:hypothetical protein